MAGTRVLTDDLIDSVGGDPTARSRVRGGPLTANMWIKLPALYKLVVEGNGVVTIDTRTFGGVVTAAAMTFVAPSADPYYPYFGEDVEDVRATYSNTAFAEII